MIILVIAAGLAVTVAAIPTGIWLGQHFERAWWRPWWHFAGNPRTKLPVQLWRPVPPADHSAS
jgi:hypothetical protein